MLACDVKLLRLNGKNQGWFPRSPTGDHSDQKLLKEKNVFSIDSRERKETSGQGTNREGSMVTENDSLALFVIPCVPISTLGVRGHFQLAEAFTTR